MFNKVVGFDTSGTYFATLTGAPYNFNVPNSIAFDGLNIWVGNVNGGTITVFRASDGAFVRLLSGATYGLSPFNGPYWLTYACTYIWVSQAAKITKIFV